MKNHRQRLSIHHCTMTRLPLLVFLSLLQLNWRTTVAETLSKPYIPYRTSPMDQDGFVHHTVDFPDDTTRSKVQSSLAVNADQCPLHFSLGISKRWHDNLDGPSIHRPPVIRSVFPASGAGKQVVYTTQYEFLDLLSPAVYGQSKGTVVQEALVQAPDFPLLWESSSFHSSPILDDINNDGIVDAIVADYDGGISVMGLASEPGKSRYFHHIQVPRLHVRRAWVESLINQTAGLDVKVEEEEEDDLDKPRRRGHHNNENKDPFHSYFEYYYAGGGSGAQQEVLRGITANVLSQDEASAQSLQKRRSRRVSHHNDEKTKYEHEEEVHHQEEPSKIATDEETSKDEEETMAEAKEDLTNAEGGKDEETPRDKDIDSNSEQAQEGNGVEEPQQQREEESGEQQKQQVQEQAEVESAAKADPRVEESGNEQQQPQTDAKDEASNEDGARIEGRAEEEESRPEQKALAKEELEEQKFQNKMLDRTDKDDVNQHVDHHEGGGDAQLSEQGEEQPNADEQAQKEPNNEQAHEENPEQEQQPKEEAAPEDKPVVEEGGQKEEENVVIGKEEEIVEPMDSGSKQNQLEQQNEAGDPEQQQELVKEGNGTPNDQVELQQEEQEEQGNVEIQQDGGEQMEQVIDLGQELQNDGQEAEEMRHRRLQEEEPQDGEQREYDEGMEPDDMIAHDDGLLQDGHTADDMFGDDGALPRFPADDEYSLDRELDQMDGPDETPPDDISDEATDDYTYGREGMLDDDYQRYAAYDDYYGDYHHDDYYDDKHYIRIPPHILSTPVLTEIPRLYGDNEVDSVLFVAASYFFDEDEYEGKFSYKRFTLSDQGDENEARRGLYVASAILAYNFDSSGRWGAQTHLDLSTDYSAPENATLVAAVPIKADLSQMGAFALGSPTVADIDGDGTPDVLIGTSMGFLYALEGRNLFKKEHWPIQMHHPIRKRPLVEDVVGDTNLEVFAMDAGGNIACFSHQAQLIWNRNILKSLGSEKAVDNVSPMTLGDINGDGYLDLVVTAKIGKQWYIFAFQAANGKDLKNFPVKLNRASEGAEEEDDDDTDNIAESVAQPLLVDLHERPDQENMVQEYIHRNSKAFNYGTRKVVSRDGERQQGGDALGLHVVQPVGTQLFIVEGGSGCTHKVVIGDEVASMVQVDDIHGTNKLDLLVATKSGNVLTLESPANYHPLNTWAGGSMRGKNSHAHGYSASQGIFVHEESRQYKDIFGVYVPITFEIFDNRPNIHQEPEKRVYKIEVRDGTSQKRTLHRVEFNNPGVYTERVYVRYGPGYYNLCVQMSTSHGITYEDCFATGYNVHFLAGFGVMLWLPLVFASIAIFLCGTKKANWDDDEADDDDRDNGNLGILGRALPT